MAKYKIMVSAFEEHKEILLYEQPDIDITTPWQWLRENFPLFNWEPILNDSEDFIQYEAEAVNTDNDDDGGSHTQRCWYHLFKNKKLENYGKDKERRQKDAKGTMGEGVQRLPR
jgi:hypothetical protein